MATGKRNYWIKLREELLFGDAVGFLMSLPNQGKYVVFYEQLCVLTRNTGGELLAKVGKVRIPFTVDKLRQECKYFTNEEITEALTILEDLGLITRQRNGIYKIIDFETMVGAETDYAAQKREQRRKKTEDNGKDTPMDRLVDTGVDRSMDNGVDNVHTDIRYKRLDIRDIDIKNLDISLSGGGGPCAGARAVSDFFSTRGLDESQYFGTTDELLSDVQKITDLLFAKFANRVATKADATAVFHAITIHETDPVTKEMRRFIPKNSLDLLLYAFEQAVYAGNPGNWNYINGVLARLSQRGLTTLADAEEYDIERHG